MGVMSIRIDDKKKKMLKIIASIQGKTIGGLIAELLDEYIEKNMSGLKDTIKEDDLAVIMQLTEESFLDWDNDEDEIYNSL
ncbi:MAG: hypothetical protein JXQ65_09305 [Candidatus Marinimicrobia bacterium]|nr:hypothetical protein [Candidatus Neomarinimicrobiota bacterium]